MNESMVNERTKKKSKPDLAGKTGPDAPVAGAVMTLPERAAYEKNSRLIQNQNKSTGNSPSCSRVHHYRGSAKCSKQDVE